MKHYIIEIATKCCVIGEKLGLDGYQNYNYIHKVTNITNVRHVTTFTNSPKQKNIHPRMIPTSFLFL